MQLKITEVNSPRKLSDSLVGVTIPRLGTHVFEQ